MEAKDWVVYVGVALLGIGVWLFISAVGCYSKWTAFTNRWTLTGGCQIYVQDKWIPAESYYFKEE